MNSPAAFLTCLAAPGFYAINTPETEAVCGIMAQMPPVQTGQGREMLKRIIEIVGFAAPLTAIPLHGMASTAVWAKALFGFRGGGQQGGQEGSEQGFAPASGVVHEFEEGKIVGQFLLRDAAVRSQPGAQQRPNTIG
jgi:hypothetical protein